MSRLGTVLIMAALACTGCGAGDKAPEAENMAVDAAAPEPNAVEENAGALNSADATDAAAVAPTGPTAPALAGYAGKGPTEKVDGVSFMEHPLVVAGIEKAIAAGEIRDWVLKDDAGPATPIVSKDGRLLSWRCQQHNCGDHNWTVAIDPASAVTEVCYHKVELTGEGSRWYKPGVAPEKRDEPCPSE